MEERIAQLLEKNNLLLEQMISLMQTTNIPQDWVDPEVAAQTLGLKLTKSRSHRRRLARAAERGLITKFRPGRPPSYYLPEIIQLSLKMKTDVVHI